MSLQRSASCGLSRVRGVAYGGCRSLLQSAIATNRPKPSSRTRRGSIAVLTGKVRLGRRALSRRRQLAVNWGDFYPAACRCRRRCSLAGIERALTGSPSRRAILDRNVMVATESYRNGDGVGTRRAGRGPGRENKDKKKGWKEEGEKGDTRRFPKQVRSVFEGNPVSSSCTRPVSCGLQSNDFPVRVRSSARTCAFLAGRIFFFAAFGGIL